jgi:hypothetical protein
MENNILQMLGDFGALGLASGAIFWMYIKMSARMDKLTDSFQEQLREQAQGHNDREAALRDRYDKVIATYNEERVEVITGIASKLDIVEKELGDVESNLKIVIELLAEREQ